MQPAETKNNQRLIRASAIASIIAGLIALLAFLGIREAPQLFPGPNPNEIVRPEEFIQTYWQKVNNRSYKEAWPMLASSIKQNDHANNYDSYVQGFEKLNLCKVRAEDIRLLQRTEESASVSVHLIFRAGSNCKFSEQDLTFYLISDSRHITWLINRVVEN